MLVRGDKSSGLLTWVRWEEEQLCTHHVSHDSHVVGSVVTRVRWGGEQLADEQQSGDTDDNDK